MKRITIVVFMLGFIISAHAMWERLGPFGGYLRDMATSPTDGDIIYVASYNSPSKVARSTDGGASWTTLGGTTGICYCYALDPTNFDYQYIGSSHSIYRSTDGGYNWQRITMSNCYLDDITVNPDAPSTVYASGMKYDTTWRATFFKSTDNGASWSSTIIRVGEYARFYTIALDPQNSNTMYLGGYDRSGGVYYPLIYKSTNGGNNWSEVGSALPTGRYIYTCAVHPANSSIVYAGASSYLFRSTDGGSTWSQVATYSNNYQLVTHPSEPNTVYCGSYYDIYKSSNSGQTWTIVDNGLSGKYFRGMAIHPNNPSTVYTGGISGVFKTTTSGSTWFQYNNNLNLATIGNFAVAPSNPNTVYTSIEEVGVYKSIDCGSNWSQLPTPVSCGNICSFAVDPSDPDILLALEGTG
jgi:photosystem II stability/assembly factor-like uncharacterized protein